MDIVHYQVGQRIPEWANRIDGCIMEYDDMSGLTLYYFLNSPNETEAASFLCDRPFQITFTPITDVGFFCFRIGQLPWSDCVFSPNAYSRRPALEPIAPRKGYALTVLLIDSSSGEIKSIRLIGLGSDFSIKFREWCLEVLDKEVSNEHYAAVTQSVFQRYNSAELAQRAWIRWSL